MWLCYKVMATRSPPSVSESRGRGLDVRAELKNHLVRHWEGSGSGCLAAALESPARRGQGGGLYSTSTAAEGKGNTGLSHGASRKSSFPDSPPPATHLLAITFHQRMKTMLSPELCSAKPRALGLTRHSQQDPSCSEVM